MIIVFRPPPTVPGRIARVLPVEADGTREVARA
jgi:hypothetical protein